MNQLTSFLPPHLIEAIGWTIVHSLWQGTIILLATAMILWILKNRSAQIKYFILFAALAGILLWSVRTFSESFQYALEKQQLKISIIQHPEQVKTMLQPSELTANQAPDKAFVNIKTVKTRAFLQRNFNWICLVWFFGLILFSSRLAGGLLYTQQLRHRQLTPVEPEWHRKISEFSDRIGLRRKVEAFTSPFTLVPLTLGTLKPIILFPATTYTGLTVTEIEAIIAHELAHILRHDYFFNIVQSIIEILFFYHPAVWMLSAQIRAERENSCDNIAIATTGDKLAYVKALATIQARGYDVETQLSMAFSGRKNSVLQRIKRIQKQVTMKTNLFEGLIAASIIITGMLLASFTIGNSPMPAKPDQQQIATTLTKAKTDSILTKFEQRVKTTEGKSSDMKELQKLTEVAYSEKDTVLAAQIASEIDLAMKSIDVDAVVKEAMRTAREALLSASKEISHSNDIVEKEQIRQDMTAARRDIDKARKEMQADIRRDMQRDGIDQKTIDSAIKAATAGMDVAASVIGSLDIESIVNSALSTASAALQVVSEIELDSLSQQQQIEIKQQIEEELKAIELQKEELKEQQKALKEQQRELKKEQN